MTELVYSSNKWPLLSENGKVFTGRVYVSFRCCRVCSFIYTSDKIVSDLFGLGNSRLTSGVVPGGLMSKFMALIHLPRNS